MCRCLAGLLGGRDQEGVLEREPQAPSRQGKLPSPLIQHVPTDSLPQERLKLAVKANVFLSDPRQRERYDLGEDEDGMDSGMVGRMDSVSQMWGIVYLT